MKFNPEFINPHLFRLACQQDCTVLIEGPTGSGKSFLARKIHENGLRKSRVFMTVNLATLNEGVLESELFGHERGAFTGAETKRIGKLELAHGGTVFLDEIGELSLRLQARLLDFMQSKTIVPVGSNKERRLNVRIIAATNRDLQNEVKEGRFREDLYHRLRVMSLCLPSLKERKDFSELVSWILSDIAREQVAGTKVLSPEVQSVFLNHHWPGNVRELRNVLEFAVLLSRGSQIHKSDLPAWFLEDVRTGGERLKPLELIRGNEIRMCLNNDYHDTMSTFEREYLKCKIAQNHGGLNKTSRQIGLNKTTLLRRIREYGLKVGEEWRAGVGESAG